MGALLAISATDIARAGVDCQHDTANVRAVKLQRVTDGDTIVLSDQTRVRIIGLNALELNAMSTADQTFARQATKSLENLLAISPLSLAQEPDPFDRHGRTLGHILLADGRNVSRLLIEQGLALAVAVGKNTHCAQFFLEAEQLARRLERGLWKKPGQWFVNQIPIGSKQRGFHLIRSNVRKLLGKGKRTTLVLENGIHATLGRDWPDLSDSDKKNLHKLTGKLVEVRGWVGSANGKSLLTLHHPANLHVLPE